MLDISSALVLLAAGERELSGSVSAGERVDRMPLRRRKIDPLISPDPIDKQRMGTTGMGIDRGCSANDAVPAASGSARIAVELGR